MYGSSQSWPVTGLELPYHSGSQPEVIFPSYIGGVGASQTLMGKRSGMLLASCDVQHSPLQEKDHLAQSISSAKTQRRCLVLAAHLDPFSSSANVPHELW